MSYAVAIRRGEVCWSADDPKPHGPATRRSVPESSEPQRATNSLVGGVQRLEEWRGPSDEEKVADEWRSWSRGATGWQALSSSL